MLLNGSNNTPGTEHVTSYNTNQTSVLVTLSKLRMENNVPYKCIVAHAGITRVLIV